MFLYNVLIHGKHPNDPDIDHCWDGRAYPTKDEAIAAIRSDAMLAEEFGKRSMRDSMYIEIDGPDINEIRENPTFQPSRDDGWRREQAMQSGMAFGCAGYNDVMGY